MKKYIIASAICCIVAISGQAQTMTEVFSRMPENRILLVDSVKRLDLMDMYKAGKHAEIKNNLNDTTLLKSFSEDYLHLQSGISSLEIALLPMINDSKVVCLIRTVCVPVCDSHIEFYTTEWKPLDSGVFIAPAPASWFIKENISNSDPDFQNNRLVLDMNLMQFHYDKETQTLSQTYKTPEYLSPEDKKRIEPYLKSEPRTFIWKQTRFE